jgi:hypothetical protein
MAQLPASFRQARWITLGTGLLAVLFFLFFNASKHNTALMKAGVFIEDPFDAVGSFAIQLAGLASLLALLRAFRPYFLWELAHDPTGRVLRANTVALVSILVTLAADGIAMLRFMQRWTQKPAGMELVGMVIGLIILAAALSWWVFRLGRSLGLFSRPAPGNGLDRFGKWGAGLFLLAAGLFLAFYPDSWRAGISGAVVMALSGMIVLFFTTAAVVWMLFCWHGRPSIDLIDDAAAVYRWSKERWKVLAPVLNGLESIGSRPGLRGTVRWLNLRKRPWIFLILVAAGMGLFLLFLEMLNEGAPDRSMVVLVVSVFIGIEGAGVVLG